ncbi:MAG: hypothetical protein R3Y27_06645 [Clostridia bacterium]
MKFKKVLSVGIVLIMMFILMLPMQVLATSTSDYSRVINVVYDDSGSMYYYEDSDDNKVNLDTWCQAKYAMEVFAAMLGENDTMNVYYMSDYTNSTTASPRLVLYGSAGAQTNVEKIHESTTTASGTPFNAVKKAYSDLASVTADEKWLVVLTDGEFNDYDDSDMDDYFAKKDEDVSVMFLGMGDGAGEITQNEEKNIFYAQSESSSDILGDITDMCTRIFNSNKLEIDVDDKEISFDVPMSELIVFAQGEDVSIESIETSDGTVYNSTSEAVEVKYSEVDANNAFLQDNEPDTDLLGKIAIFEGDFDAGDYTVNVSNAETIEVYYKPNVEIAAFLADSEGNEVTDFSTLEEGEYVVSFDFVKTGTTDVVPQSDLLGIVTYEAIVTNNGIEHEDSYSNGDTIYLEEGSLVIDVTAQYLDYNVVSTSLSYEIYTNKDVSFAITQNPTYVVLSEGFEDQDQYVYFEMQVQNITITQDIWDIMEIPTVSIVDSLGFSVELSDVEKTSDIGVYRVCAYIEDNLPSTGTYTDFEYEISFKQNVGDETWAGSFLATINMNDTRGWWERNWALFIKMVISFWILVFLAGYLPFIKNYLPRTLSKKPLIKCNPKAVGDKKSKSKTGLYEKNFVSTVLPYVSQKGKIKCVATGITGCPVLQIKAKRKRSMVITNTKAFSGKDILFDSTKIKKLENGSPEIKKLQISAGTCVKFSDRYYKYSCTLNQDMPPRSSTKSKTNKRRK